MTTPRPAGGTLPVAEDHLVDLMRSLCGRGRSNAEIAADFVRPEERQDGHHAAVIVDTLGQAELGEDARHVLLDGAIRDARSSAMARFVRP